ncbi:MAG: LLM class flavin-dependent oxidoreductase [Rhodospirillaceae bacterium]|jgi:luciferase family oxidoreductase group 1|nr:LLM class flavin-dependent oxidoreductase [Rhodospirillaceae bacterium]MBT5945974.1 LLM class flavin-dependent oxidoreductase [Rhodospirillaceae bacterium]MBT6405650.1 LLM class flavin-dependent oxidoreductase [Rhodospirillaceae bacterium]MBT6534887.1 LLM class flavin-dependent oxidoreductase [Rhodospirillaceae bacterium]MBT7362760.1 LLM class flavin-dependent oxidoreductase [Rhodospirillaceae bacterium]
MVKLSVLDQSPVRQDGDARQALEETIALAQATERLGYTRYWLAEHHGTVGFAGSSPEIMVTRVAAATRHIRVGSGGVMLSHYSPLKVAENFKLLENLYPGRIDLGIGRAPGSDGATAAALAYGSEVGIEYFPTKIADMVAFLADAPPATEPFKNVRATPAVADVPEVWLLGSSDQSAAYAAHFGLAYSFAHFIAPQVTAPVLKYYRDKFQPSDNLGAPRANAGVFVICADTQEEADYLAASRDLWRLRLNQGQHFPYAHPDEALAYDYSAQDRRVVEANRANRFAGTPESLRDQLTAFADAHGFEEMLVLTITHNFETRLRSYELLAEAFDLDRRDAAAE